MKSSLPKPLHKVAGRTMLAHSIAAAEELSPDHIIIVAGREMPQLVEAAAPHTVAIQGEPLGTGHAVMAGMSKLEGFTGDILVMFADTPLVTPNTLKKLLDRRQATDDPAVVLAAIQRTNPFGYGRILCDALGRPQRIIEERDANEEQRKITLCNSGIMAFAGKELPNLLSKLTTDNAQNALYLTDTVAHARQEGHTTALVEIPEEEVLGVNTRAQLAEVETVMQGRLRARHMANGVTLINPLTVTFSWDTEVGRDVIIHPHVVFGPGVNVPEGAEIPPFTYYREGY
jgi:bifunctional UDP-N-acetylglucosamine pyrophosphorylase/glucosamine-1-phosphate N-acetyltransferase